MSTDYFLVCHEKKVIMPLISLSGFGVRGVSKYWIEDFIGLTQGAPVVLLREQHDDLPDCDDEEKNWTSLNAWHPHADDPKPKSKDVTP